jgi:hypothetical protein
MSLSSDRIPQKITASEASTLYSEHSLSFSLHLAATVQDVIHQITVFWSVLAQHAAFECRVWKQGNDCLQRDAESRNPFREMGADEQTMDKMPRGRDQAYESLADLGDRSSKSRESGAFPRTDIPAVHPMQSPITPSNSRWALSSRIRPTSPFRLRRPGPFTIALDRVLSCESGRAAVNEDQQLHTQRNESAPEICFFHLLAPMASINLNFIFRFPRFHYQKHSTPFSSFQI